MVARSSKEGSSPVGLVIRKYRQERGITQKQFARQLGVEARTLRMYENGERVLENISDLRRIADLLEIDPTELGLAAREQGTSTAEQIHEVVEQVASLLLQARLAEAHTTIETLLQSLRARAENADVPFLHALASAHCLAGHVWTMTRKTGEIAYMLQQYQEVERIAHVLKDQTLLCIALSYYGDMLRRRGEIGPAIDVFEKVRASTPEAETGARGNAALLLGRAHLSGGNFDKFVQEMAQAEELAYSLTSTANSALTQFSLGAVYAEYARAYGITGQLEKSQHYLQLAEEHLPTGRLRDILLKATRAEAQIHAGEIPAALPGLIEVARLARSCGYQRLVERLYRLQSYLDDQSILLRQASRSLGEALYGPVELG